MLNRIIFAVVVQTKGEVDLGRFRWGKKKKRKKRERKEGRRKKEKVFYRNVIT